ncbi:MAG: hypothetical protein EB003_10725, partial [Flavobacteriia bacterium]|nr:hypothetical protein [Flavobacteriia bacterium]
MLLGALNRLLGITQFLWYSHHYADLYLRFSHKFANYFFSPTLESFPLQLGAKVIATGHAINFDSVLFGTTDYSAPRKRDKLLNIGRIAPVKRIENLIYAVSEYRQMCQLELSIQLVGPSQ